MFGIDTNILIRYLTGDHPEQSAKARALMMKNDIFVSTTVLLECEWVLRHLYEFGNAETIAALRGIAGLPNVTVENSALLADALDHTEAGLDFADALHLGSAGRCEAFLTFDRKFIRAAADSSLKVGEPL